jgi:hypothetical protein
MAVHKTSRYRTQKSPDWRFLLVLRLMIFFVYVALAIILIFWDSIPFTKNYFLSMGSNYRIALGILLIVYAFIRFIRLIPKKDEE